MNVLRHMTWRGRYETALEWLWRCFHRTAPDHARCFMGAPVAPIAHCPRPSVEGELWCGRHRP